MYDETRKLDLGMAGDGSELDWVTDSSERAAVLQGRQGSQAPLAHLVQSLPGPGTLAWRHF